MKAVKCPLCGGNPQFVYLAPNKGSVGMWETEYGLEPVVLFKYIECKGCKARTAGVSLMVDQAVADWNEKAKSGRLVIPYGTEDC